MATFPASGIMSLTAGAPRFDLAESVGPDLRLGELLDEDAQARLSELALGYGTSAGDADLRALVAELNGVEADDVVITVGGMHALFLVAFTLCNADDEAVAAAPLFPPARNVLEAVRAGIRTVRVSFDDGYRLDPGALAQQLTPRTRLVSLATPQNPSGVALAPETIAQVLASIETMCPHAYLLLDETYREAAYGNDRVAPGAAGSSARVISTASLSKCHGAPGLRLGWAISRDRALVTQLVNAKFNTVVSCSAVDEALAVEVLRQRERIVAARREKLAAGLAIVAAWVEENRGLVEWVRPDAGALCCLRLRLDVFDTAAVERFYANLADAGVRVGNGTWFGEQARVFRLGFGLLPLPELRTALALSQAALKAAALPVPA